MINDSYKAKKKKKRDGFIVLVVGRTMLFLLGEWGTNQLSNHDTVLYY